MRRVQMQQPAWIGFIVRWTTGSAVVAPNEVNAAIELMAHGQGRGEVLDVCRADVRAWTRRDAIAAVERVAGIRA